MGLPRIWILVALLASASFAVAVVRADDSVTLPDSETAPAGYYPPAPSAAVGMTPEWRAFADEVDRICALSFNHALAIEAQIEQIADLHRWGDARADAAIVAVWADQLGRNLVATGDLGKPPASADLFASWRANVAERMKLFLRASDVARRGRFNVEKQIFDRIHHLKARADVLGQRFGLRICTSN